jgi:hypothetical protein
MVIGRFQPLEPDIAGVGLKSPLPAQVRTCPDSYDNFQRDCAKNLRRSESRIPRCRGPNRWTIGLAGTRTGGYIGWKEVNSNEVFELDQQASLDPGWRFPDFESV